jgi:uncharacterized protein (TIGR03437 family)
VRWLCFFGLASVLWAAPTIKVSPAALSFSFVQGVGIATASQTLSVAAVANGQVIPFAVQPPSSPWLTVTPESGRTTLVIRVTVNVTSLIVGNYADQLTIAPSEGANREPILVPVSLTIQSPPSNIVVSPGTLDFVTRLGDNTAVPPLPIQLSTTGGLLPFNVSTRGTNWLSATPSTGNVFPGFRTPVQIAVNPAGLSPGAYTGTITVNTPTAVTKTTTVNARLTVQPGLPEISSVWPASLPAQSPTSIVTIRGTRFFTGTVARVNNEPVLTIVLGDSALQITIPASMMTESRVLPITVTNPGTGGGQATASFVTTLPGPVIRGIGHAANQTATAAPGSLLVIYGQNIGPETLVAFDPLLPRVPISLAGVAVELQGEPAPILYAWKDQICIAIPYALEVNRPYMIQVTYASRQSNLWPILITPSAPGLFTASGAAAGPVAAYAYDEEKKEYYLVTEAAPALRGGFAVLYATGEGMPVQATDAGRLDGVIAQRASQPHSPVTVTVGGLPAEVHYAGVSPGLIVGIIQLNIRIPPTVAPAKDVPVAIRIRGVTSPAGPTLNVK